VNRSGRAGLMMKNNRPLRDALSIHCIPSVQQPLAGLAPCLAVRGVNRSSYLYIAHVIVVANASISVMFKYLCIRYTNPIHTSPFLPASRQTHGIGKADQAT